MTAWQALREAPRRIGEAAAQARPVLRPIASPPRRMGTVPFAVLMVLLLALGMVGVLLLTTQLQGQAFEVREAQRQARERGYRGSALEAHVTRTRAPEQRARAATALGMVPYPHGVFIDLATGQVVGEATPARGDEVPSLRVHEPAPVVPAPDGAPASDGAPAPAGAAPADGVPAAAADAPAPDAAAPDAGPAAPATAAQVWV